MEYIVDVSLSLQTKMHMALVFLGSSFACLGRISCLNYSVSSELGPLPLLRALGEQLA